MGPSRVWMQSENIPGLAMSRSFGDKVASEVGVISVPDIFEVNLKDFHKILILASDGIWTVLTNDRVIEIAEKYYKSDQAEMACAALVNEATDNWNKAGQIIDDITVIVVFIK